MTDINCDLNKWWTIDITFLNGTAFNNIHLEWQSWWCAPHKHSQRKKEKNASILHAFVIYGYIWTKQHVSLGGNRMRICFFVFFFLINSIEIYTKLEKIKRSSMARKHPIFFLLFLAWWLIKHGFDALRMGKKHSWQIGLINSTMERLCINHMTRFDINNKCIWDMSFVNNIIEHLIDRHYCKWMKTKKPKSFYDLNWSNQC